MRLRLCFILSALFAVAVGIAVLPGPDGTARAQGGGECPFQIGDADARECRCTAAATESGSIWGTDVYTADSPICRAARHAGVIGADGGLVRVRAAPGRASYAASTRGGVASGDWASYGRSIAFDGGAFAIDDGPAACPANAVGQAAGASLTCACGVDAAGSGSVWGSGPYTADSSICRAARHAGVIGRDGGEVRVRVVAGQSTYAASERNGVPSSAWGSYGTSFTFDR